MVSCLVEPSELLLSSLLDLDCDELVFDELLIEEIEDAEDDPLELE